MKQAHFRVAKISFISETTLSLQNTITATAMQRPIVMQRPYYNPSSQAFAPVIFVLDN